MSRSVAPMVELLPSRQEVLGSVPRTTYARYNDAHLSSKHLGSGGWGIRSSV